jgi:hypothetical protein
MFFLSELFGYCPGIGLGRGALRIGRRGTRAVPVAFPLRVMAGGRGGYSER